MAPPRVLPLLYRNLLRSARTIERLAKPCHASPIYHCLEHAGPFDPRTDWQEPTTLVSDVRAGFRRGDGSIGQAFTALRGAGDVLHWLHVSTKLGDLDRVGAPELEGCLLIEETIRGPDEMRAHQAGSRLSEMAGMVQEMLRGGDTSRLGKLAALNAAVLGNDGSRGLSTEAAFDDVEASSCIGEVLDQGRGLPITLCVAYQSVAAQLGLRLQLTNFPGRVLLRLEPTDRAALPGPGPQPGDELCGRWQAQYGAHGNEIVDVTLCERGDGEHWLQAVKLTGDVNIPAGELSWEVRIAETMLHHPQPRFHPHSGLRARCRCGCRRRRVRYSASLSGTA